VPVFATSLAAFFAWDLPFDVRVDLGLEFWPVRIDPSQLDQILANLCVNASAANADIGKMIIETGTASTDVLMPEMNGRELAKQIRIINPDMKVLYMLWVRGGCNYPSWGSWWRHKFSQKPFARRDLSIQVKLLWIQKSRGRNYSSRPRHSLLLEDSLILLFLLGLKGTAYSSNNVLITRKLL
jgi:DNA-binding NtrC family response regulator